MQTAWVQPPFSVTLRLHRVARLALASAVACCTPVDGLRSQGVMTASLHVNVRAADGADIDGARVKVLNTATGFGVTGEVRRGRFVAQGLEFGGPYTISVGRLGFHLEQRERVFLGFGEPHVLHFVLRPQVRPLDTLRVASSAPFPQTSSHGGTGTTISESFLQQMPTLNRDMYDFVRLVPQISMRTGFRAGFSGGGGGLRFNEYLVNGDSERSPYFNASAAFSGSRSVPLAAVKEYQVLLTPYDVRYGDFTGAVVNTVSRSGTNEFEGSVFATARSDRLARRDSLAPYDRAQVGLSLGGPMVRDRLHFFVAPEFQHVTSPAPGPYVGQPSSAETPVPVSAADVARLGDLLRKYGLDAGTGGLVENRNPLRQIFGRLDYTMPRWNSRMVLWTNYSRSSGSSFARLAVSDSFHLSSWQVEESLSHWFTSMQVQTALPRLGGAHNELVVSRNVYVTEPRPAVRQPVVIVSVPGIAGGTKSVLTGTRPSAQASSSLERVIQISDNLTLPVGSSHLLTLGAMVAPFYYDADGVSGAYGTWWFSSLDQLDRGIAEQFELRRDFGSASVPINGTHSAMYAVNRWLASDRVAVTMGIRADLLMTRGHPTYNPEVDSIFQRRTDVMPGRRVHWSPRVGFTWDVTGTGRGQVRGGAGIFTGRPPLNWIHAAFTNYGVGIDRMTCDPRKGAPAFVPDPTTPPAACADGSGFTTPHGDAELLDPELQMGRTLRASLAWDRRLLWDVLGTAEALVTRNLADFMFVNLNLKEPQAADRNGRVMYGTIDASRGANNGMARPDLRLTTQPQVTTIGLVNTSRGHAYQLSGRLEKQFSHRVAATASYTFSRVRDVSTPVRTAVGGAANWSARAVSGRHDDMSAGVSLNDVPHRVILAGSYRAPWERWPTHLSFYYVGESGSPFTYVAALRSGRGDLNADGSNANDPIYIPRSAYDTTEIRFSGVSDSAGADNSLGTQAARVRLQQDAFERFIAGAPCLQRQRGQIMARNGCREPWSHTTVASVRQAIPAAGRALEVELQVFNVLNLLRSSWGLSRVAYGRSDVTATPPLLEHVGQIDGTPATAQSVFRFDARTPRWTTRPELSAFQLQLALRYRF